MIGREYFGARRCPVSYIKGYVLCLYYNCGSQVMYVSIMSLVCKRYDLCFNVCL